jgi:sialate O-acetylesterase
VGRRLGLLARQQIYGQPIEGTSPAPLAISHKGKAVTISFDHTGKGLETREWDRAIGFSLCDAVDKCSFVDGVVSKDSVTLDASRHPKAIAVRFCWADSPLCNLVNSEGLPAVPFELPIASPKKHLAKQL